MGIIDAMKEWISNAEKMLNKKKIILTRWIPASWKSTWARSQLLSIRFNKDIKKAPIHIGAFLI